MKDEGLGAVAQSGVLHVRGRAVDVKLEEYVAFKLAVRVRGRILDVI